MVTKIERRSKTIEEISEKAPEVLNKLVNLIRVNFCVLDIV